MDLLSFNITHTVEMKSTVEKTIKTITKLYEEYPGISEPNTINMMISYVSHLEKRKNSLHNIDKEKAADITENIKMINHTYFI